MATMHLTIRDDLRAWAEAQVGEGRYASADELVNRLLDGEREEERKREWLHQALEEGFASGSPVSGEQAFAAIRAKYRWSDA